MPIEFSRVAMGILAKVAKSQYQAGMGEFTRSRMMVLIAVEVATVSTSPPGVTRLKPMQTADGARRVQPLMLNVRNLVDAINAKETGAIPRAAFGFTSN